MRADLPAGVEPLDDGDPTQAGPYLLTGRIGVGGMGSVYYGQAPGGAPVAVKVIRREYAREPEFRTRFLREAQAARRVARFCTAEVLDVDTDRTEPYLVTEFIDGPTLTERVRRAGPLPAAELERVGVAVAGALSAIHGAGLIHRDLKPGNILLSSSGARVIDFGIARALEATTTLTQRGVLGTPAYMAPEQALGEPLTPAADVYAWGAVMLYAATGRTPHGEAVTPVLMYRIVHDEPDLSGLTPTLHALVTWTMNRDPAARPSATALLLRLTGATPHPVVAADAAPAPPTAPPPPTATPWSPLARADHASMPRPLDVPSADAPTSLTPAPVLPPPPAVGPTAAGPTAAGPTAAGPTGAGPTGAGPTGAGATRAGGGRRPWLRPALAAAVVVVVAAAGVGLAVGLRDDPPANATPPVSPTPSASTSASAGPSAGSVTLTDYRGRESTLIVARLRRAGLTVRTVSEPSVTSARGRVLDTTPPSGTRVAPGGVVVLKVGDGSQAEARGWRVFPRYADGASMNRSPIIVVDPAGTEHQVGVGDHPSLSPDASRVIFTGTDGEIVSVRTSDGGDPRQITDEPDGSSDYATFSPDGRTIAYARNIGGIFLINTDGSGRRRISALRDAFELSFAPDGDRLAYRSGRDQALHVVRRDGTDTTLATSPVAGDGIAEPTWSPDGRTIAFSTATGGLYLYTVDGGGTRAVGPPGSWHPSWSPQGGLVYVQDTSAGRFFAATGPVRVRNPDGTGDSLLDTHPASGPVRWAAPTGS